MITRCNYTLFNEAVNVCCAKNDTKVGFVGVSRTMVVFFVFFSPSECENYET